MYNNSECEKWKPVEGNIMTTWSKDVSPKNVLPEYPRPQMVRKIWMNLNGLWDYAITLKDQDKISSYDGKILVPYPLESALSGVKKQLFPSEWLWYRRDFTVPNEWKNEKLLLHFGAVDWRAEVYVNGIKACQHEGGYYPFSVEISKLVHNGNNELVVVVWDSTDALGEERGKQTLNPKGIFYTSVSGIWQTVWLEPVANTFIDHLKITPDIDNELVNIETFIKGDLNNLRIETEIYEDHIKVCRDENKDNCFKLRIPSPKLWSPDSPFLYKLKIKLIRDEILLDEIDSYFAMRKISTKKDKEGITRIFLNNEPIFQSGLLDQGYWPDGIYTAPNDDALRFDIEMAKKMGFNMLRKHIKVESLRWYYYCDSLGIMVWQDMPSGGRSFNLLYNHILPVMGINIKDKGKLSYNKFQRMDYQNRENYKKELKEMIDNLYNVPCIITWVPFNEGWGQFDAAEISSWIKKYDASRLVDHASGWYDQLAGDFKSVHIYNKKLCMPKKFNNRSFVISEFGGYGLKESGHVWKEHKEYSYSEYKSKEELKKAYINLINNELIPLINKGLCASVYTQITDVETEINGIITYDREIIKIDPKTLYELNNSIYDKLKNP